MKILSIQEAVKQIIIDFKRDEPILSHYFKVGCFSLVLRKWPKDPEFRDFIIACLRENTWACCAYDFVGIDGDEILDDELKLIALEKDPWVLAYFKSPTEEMQIKAVSQNARIIKGIKSPSESVLLAAANSENHCFEIFKYHKNTSEKVQMAGIKKDFNSILYIDNPSEDIKLFAVKQNGHALQLLANKTKVIQMENYSPPSREIQLEAIKTHGQCIQFVDDPDEEMQLESIKSSMKSKPPNIYPVYHIKKVTPKVQLKALKAFYSIKENDGEVIAKDYWEDECKLINIKKSGNAIMYFSNPTKEMQQEYVNYCFKNNCDIIKDAIPDLDLTIVQNNIDCMELIK